MPQMGAPVTPPGLPGSVAGAPGGPGPSPVVSPGQGQGNQAAMSGIVKAVIPGLHKALMSFPVGSKEYKAVMRALSSLTPVFGAAEQENLVPPAIAQLAQAAKRGGQIGGAAPAPGVAGAPAPGGGGSPMPMAA